MATLKTLLTASTKPEALSDDERAVREKLRVSQMQRQHRLNVNRALTDLAVAAKATLAVLECPSPNAVLTEEQHSACFCSATKEELSKTEEAIRNLLDLIA